MREYLGNAGTKVREHQRGDKKRQTRMGGPENEADRKEGTTGIMRDEDDVGSNAGKNRVGRQKRERYSFGYYAGECSNA